jgi:katanin p80 WD40 repeat-containing subunit B1
MKLRNDGKWIDYEGEEGLIKMWEIRDGRIMKEFKENEGNDKDVEFNNNEFMLD